MSTVAFSFSNLSRVNHSAGSGSSDVKLAVICENWKEISQPMDQVISEKQRALNKALHQNSQDYGNRADGAGVASELPVAVQRMHELGVCNSLLDYGTGKGSL